MSSDKRPIRICFVWRLCKQSVPFMGFCLYAPMGMRPGLSKQPYVLPLDGLLSTDTDASLAVKQNSFSVGISGVDDVAISFLMFVQVIVFYCNFMED
jgi:hypothetical protein